MPRSVLSRMARQPYLCDCLLCSLLSFYVILQRFIHDVLLDPIDGPGRVATLIEQARESSVTHKSAITDHAMEENHVIDWGKGKVVDREAQRQTRWIKEALWIRRTPMCMNRDAGSYQLSHTWDQVISRSRAPWFPGHVLHRAVNNQDVIKMSDGHRNIVIR